MKLERVAKVKNLKEAQRFLKGVIEGPFLILSWSLDDKMMAVSNTRDYDKLVHLAGRFVSDASYGWYEAELPDE